MPKPEWKRSAATLLLILTASLAAGCVTPRACPEMPLRPTEPRIYRLPAPEGQFCLDLENAALLFEYIDELERGYGQ